MSKKENEPVELRLCVSKDVKNKFKGVCAMQGLTMSEVIAQFMQNYVNQQHNNNL
ncbi:copy number control protein [Anabaena sp. CCY 9910]|uniref:copy number control protein n=1 Tax=Anabaena sp. CCY 9910 TaxID=3103870 RepID=UPI0039DFC4F3